ncbi:MAG: ATP synthase F1 subunit delta [Bacteroidetes bacterium]|jgi:F-type H+-transporting ATPase subunit delta|nr:ATP synthase F1 subunit delta [Bacteroidota bacterium]
MSDSRVARRYAQALLDAAAGVGREEPVAADLEMLRTVIRGSSELRLLLKSPVVKQERKQEVLRAAFQGHVEPLTQEFMALLTEKGREQMLSQVIVEFQRLRDRKLGIVTLEVGAATTLSADQTEALRQRFEALTHKTVQMTVTVDASLKGGLTARLGDTVYDGSIRRQLELLRKRFALGDGAN